ncbi:MAG: sodium:proton antiporter, partial [Chitinophagaceae bacterium]
LLYEAAWATSWKDLWRWRRIISSFAFLIVIMTSFVVALISSALIPGFTLALGFLLGGIVSPPDAVAAATVLKGMRVPKRVVTILEGESLVNDASSLIVFRFALAAILTGTFSLQQAVGQFFLVSLMGVAIGLAGAHLMYAIHRFLPTTPAIDAALTVMTPYILFLSAEHFHYSGVMAVVSGGLFMSFRAHEVFKTGSTRMNMVAVWHTLIFVMNALVFILIGLELPEIILGLGDISIAQAIMYGVYVSIIAILVRMLWVYSASYIPRWISKKFRERPVPDWRHLLIIGWAGMRGVVSLATALSIPVLLKTGEAFPNRSLIIFITFTLIFITLVFQGLTLPLMIKATKISEIDPILPDHEQHAGIRLRLDIISLHQLNVKHERALRNNNLIKIFAEKLKGDIEGHQKFLTSSEVCTGRAHEREEFQLIMANIYELQRLEIARMKREKTFTDEALRNAEQLLDINDLKLSKTMYK